MKKTLSIMLSLVMITSFFAGTSLTAAGNTSATSEELTAANTASVKTLEDGMTYFITKNLTINSGKSNKNGLVVDTGATVTLNIPYGTTLTVYGKNGSGRTGGGAAILLPNGATLKIVGKGKLVAVGGNAGNGSTGGSGSRSIANDNVNGHYKSEYGSNTVYFAGAGGTGGNGGGGAGAGIGTNGGNGGSGSGAGGSGWRDDGIVDSNRNGYGGSAGASASSASASGNLICASTIDMTGVVGGSAGSAGGSGSRGSNGYDGDEGDARGIAGGAGGGGGGGGLAGAAVGTGGGGGGQGGGGGSAGYIWGGRYVGGGGGGGGQGNGTSGGGAYGSDGAIPEYDCENDRVDSVTVHQMSTNGGNGTLGSYGSYGKGADMTIESRGGKFYRGTAGSGGRGGYSGAAAVAYTANDNSGKYVLLDDGGLGDGVVYQPQPINSNSLDSSTVWGIGDTSFTLDTDGGFFSTDKQSNGALPDDGIIETSDGISYQLSWTGSTPYAGNDSVRFVGEKSGDNITSDAVTVKMGTQGVYDKIYILGTAGGFADNNTQPLNFALTLNYADGSTSQTTYSLYDWYTPISNIINQEIGYKIFKRLNADGTTIDGDFGTNGGPMLQSKQISCDKTKVLESITFQIADTPASIANAESIYAAIYAITGIIDSGTPKSPEISVQNIDYDSFTVDWDAVDGATGYAVDVSKHSSFRDENGEASFISGYLNKTVTESNIKIEGLDETTTYYCRVRSIGDDGAQSASSNVAEATTTIQTFTVSFNANGGSGNMAEQTNVVGEYTLPSNGFNAPNGYAFKGWATDASGNVITTNQITVSNDTTLYAIWEKIPAEKPSAQTSGNLTLTYGDFTNQKITIDVDKKNGYIYSYQWTDDNGNTVSTSDTLNVDDDTVVGSYNYSCVVTATREDNDEAATITLDNISVKVIAKTINNNNATINLNKTEFTYNGQVQKPTVTVSCGGSSLVEGTDYTISWPADCQNAGNKNIVVNFKGNYSGSAEKSFNIAKKSLTVKANDKTITYGDTPANSGVTYTGFVADEDESVLGGSLAYTYGYKQYDNVGTYDITVSGLVSNNYEITFEKGTLTVNQKEIGINWGVTDFVYNGEKQKPTATATKTVNGDQLTLTVSGAEKNVSTTDYTATVTAIGGEKAGNYKLPDNVTVNFNIAKKSLTVKANNKTITYGDTPSNSGVTYTGFVDTEDESVLGGSLAYTYGYKQYDNIGTYDITVSGLVSNNYEITFEKGTLTVNQKEIGISWGVTDFVYNGEKQKPTATATKTVNGDQLTLTVSGAEKNASATDYTATVTAIGGEKAANYKLPDDVTVNFNIDKTPLTVKANDNTIAYGDAPSNSGVTYTGFVADEDENVLDGVLTYSYGYNQYDNIGTYDITVSGLISDNYEITFEKGTLTVNKKEIGISWGVTDFVYNGEEQKPTATATKTVNDDQLTLTVSGAEKNASTTDYTATVTTISGEKAGNYKLPYNVTTNFTIVKAEQSAPTVNKEDETIFKKADGKLTDVSPKMEYRAESESNYTAITDTVIENLAAGKYFVRYTQDDNHNPSPDAEVIIEPGKMLVVTYKADGQVVATVEVAYGEDATAPSIPEKEGYTQIAPTWDNDGTNVTSDIEINAVYTINEYTLTFTDENGVSQTLTYKHGETVVMPKAPTKKGYVVKWEKIGDDISADVEIKAIYTKVVDVVPDDIELKDKAKLEEQKKQFEEMLKDDSYSEEDKQMIQNAIDKIDKALSKLKTLGHKESPATNDHYSWLWFALMLISGAGIFAITTYERKKRVKTKR